ncbi:hypothetical protein SAMN05216266_11742 [Amycolatopsis marina]|uniref:Uncharacterized protein n=1 Tax=Amycolatopsis marina TaxID=490629 RepID=A0A1I1BUE1_9PSEU|nr:hypothetical protein SAMN05216266_11742 [Amycolatopsis marina]
MTSTKRRSLTCPWICHAHSATKSAIVVTLSHEESSIPANTQAAPGAFAVRGDAGSRAAEGVLLLITVLDSTFAMVTVALTCAAGSPSVAILLLRAA